MTWDIFSIPTLPTSVCIRASGPSAAHQYILSLLLWFLASNSFVKARKEMLGKETEGGIPRSWLHYHVILLKSQINVNSVQTNDYFKSVDNFPCTCEELLMIEMVQKQFLKLDSECYSSTVSKQSRPLLLPTFFYFISSLSSLLRANYVFMVMSFKDWRLQVSAYDSE